MASNNKTGTCEISSNKLFQLLTKTDYTLTAVDELHKFNILKEYNKLKKCNYDNLSDYDKAIFHICEYIIECVRHDKYNGDYYTEDNAKKIKQAGQLLYKYDGNSVMHDVLELWVPKRYCREFDMLWNGIGGWRG